MGVGVLQSVHKQPQVDSELLWEEHFVLTLVRE